MDLEQGGGLSFRTLAASFAAMVLLLSSAAYWTYNREARAIRRDKYNELKAIADLKVRQLVQWRDEQISDARLSASAACLVSSALFKSSDRASSRAGLLPRLDEIRRTNLHCAEAVVTNPDGVVLLAAGTGPEDLDAGARELVARALAARDVVIGDFVRYSGSGKVYLDVVAPMLSVARRPLGALVLRVDPEPYLYPLLQFWPARSRTSETLLVRREGDAVLFLNTLRQQPGPPLTLRIPLSGSDVPASRAARGQTGEFEGPDYRGVKVLADVRGVPGSPWFMVTKVDAGEILAEVHYRGWAILVILILAVLLTAATMGLVLYYRRQRIEALDVLLQLRRAVEQSPVSVIITDLVGNVEYVNPQFVETSGYTSDEVRGKNLRILKSGETPAAKHRELWDTLTRGEKWGGEFRNRRKDGTLFWARAMISPLRDSPGAVTHYLGIERDITTEKELEAQLVHSQRMESVGRLAGGVAHDFNNLLTVVIGFSDAALSALKEDDPLRRPLEEIRRAGGQAAVLTRQLLAVSRKQVIPLGPVNLTQTISSARSMIEHLMGEDIVVSVNLSPEAGHVLADEGQLQHVLLNLALNSRDAMPSGGGFSIATRRVEADPSETARYAWVKPGRYVEISATDTGSGIDPEHKRHIFEPFFTTKAVGKGTGLGLSTAYGFVRQCGGWISVTSEPGQGATFRVCLPEVEPAPVEAAAPPAVGDLRGAERILLVEDHDDVRGFAAEALRRHGYTVLEAKTPLKALELAGKQDGNTDLLLTAVIMPQMTGKDLAERLQPACRNLRVLFMSGHGHDAITALGVTDTQLNYIEKPFTGAALAEKVRSVLGAPVGTS